MVLPIRYFLVLVCWEVVLKECLSIKSSLKNKEKIKLRLPMHASFIPPLRK